MTKVRAMFKVVRPLMVAILVASGLAGGAVGLALAGDGEVPHGVLDPVPLQAEEERCALCHPDIVETWEGGAHHLAFDDELFQSGWESQDFDQTCLECHTTGFVPATGEYVEGGVGCPACHGDSGEDHPPAPMDLDRANETCRNCHTVTYAEFRVSLHEANDMLCTSCHYAHTNGLRFETEVAQCLNCHSHQLDDFAHASHVQARGMTCRNCHGYVEPGTERRPDGQYPSGHDFQENVVACLDCHKDIKLTPLNDGNNGTDGFETGEMAELISSGQEAAVRISELEAYAETLELEARNRSNTGLLEGAAGGLLVGGVMAWLVTRRRPQELDEGEYDWKK